MEDREQLRERIMTQRREIISALETEGGTKVITLMHRREPWEADSKEQEAPHLTVEDSEFILMQIRSTPPDQPD